MKSASSLTNYISFTVLLALSFLLNSSEGKLTILSPSRLYDKFKATNGKNHKCVNLIGTIDANYANFGYIPYGHQIVS